MLRAQVDEEYQLWCHIEGKRHATYSISILTEELPAYTPEVISVRTRGERRIGTSTGRSLDEFFDNSMRFLPFSPHLLQ